MTEEDTPDENGFKERAYKILYEKYKSMFMNIQNRARSKAEYGEDASIKETLGFIGNPDKYSYCGIIQKEDIAIVNTLEECLGINPLLKDAK
jgi:hypothetical protein